MYDAVGNFHYGSQASIDTLKLLKLNPGFVTLKMCNELNVKRKYNSGYKNPESSKLRRKVTRNNRKRKQDSNTLKEGKTYEAGGFNCIFISNSKCFT